MDFELGYFNRPIQCRQCKEAIMVYKGLGEYECEKCKFSEYDDYGKVRNYIEDNPGSNISVISENTGVTKRSINTMLKEKRFEVTNDSRTFLTCEICRKSIRSGRYCPECESKFHKQIEEKARKHNTLLTGYGMQEQETDSGSKRFRRSDD